MLRDIFLNLAVDPLPPHKILVDVKLAADEKQIKGYFEVVSMFGCVESMVLGGLEFMGLPTMRYQCKGEREMILIPLEIFMEHYELKARNEKDIYEVIKEEVTKASAEDVNEMIQLSVLTGKQKFWRIVFSWA